MTLGSMPYALPWIQGGQRSATSHDWPKCAQQCRKVRPSMAWVPSDGRSNALGESSSGCTPCDLGKRMCGASWAAWDSARRNSRNKRLNATKMPCGIGSIVPCRGSEKSPARMVCDRLHRRVGHPRTAHTDSYLGLEGPHARHSLQLKPRLDDRWTPPKQRRVLAARGKHQESAGRRLSEGLEGASEATLDDHLGQAASSSEPSRARERRQLERADLIPLRTIGCIRSESCRVLVGWPKRHAFANYCPKDLRELHTGTRNKSKCAQNCPSMIATCWMQATLW